MYHSVISENLIYILKLVRWISGRRNRNGTVTTDAMTSAVQKQQSQARKRIVLFLSVFVITGFISKLSENYKVMTMIIIVSFLLDVVIFIYLVFFLSFDFVNNSHRKVLKLVDVERDMLYAQVCKSSMYSCIHELTLL